MSKNKTPLPSRLHQVSTISAFRTIVQKQKTPEGLPWKSARILDELWELWEERPAEKWQKINFVEAGSPVYQKVDRLKSGRTNSLKNDALLFSLIDKFVRKHTLPGDFVVPGEDVSLLYDTGEKFLLFSYSQGLWPRIEIYDEYGQKRLMEKYGIFVFELFKTGEKSDKGNNTKYLAFRIPRKGDDKLLVEMWPAALIYKDTLYCEIGFYISNRDSFFLRSISSVYDPDYAHPMGSSGNNTLMDCNYRQLTISLRSIEDELGKGEMLATDDIITDITSEIKYSIKISDCEFAYQLCRKLIRLLDNKADISP